MHARPRRATPILFLLALAAPALAADDPAPDDPAPDEPTPEEIAEAGALFAASCTQCHLPPDPAHPTDRAWLDQVRDTA
jgi:mono/diheme cytochrome c family protein